MEQPVITAVQLRVTQAKKSLRRLRQLTRLASLLVRVPYACSGRCEFESLCGDELSDFDFDDIQ